MLHPSRRTELLMTTVPPPSNLIFTEIKRLGTLGAVKYEASPHAKCLHCADGCDHSIPAAKYFDTQKNQYWVFGPFCSSPCVYGYLCEHNASSKQIATTHAMLRDYYGITKVTIAPPREAHERFGGSYAPDVFYGTNTLDVVEPPFVTFSQYVMSASKGNDAYELLPQSAGKLSDLHRPTMRITPLATKSSTGSAPMLLEYLASLKDVTKKRPREEEPKKAAGGSLARYLKQL